MEIQFTKRDKHPGPGERITPVSDVVTIEGYSEVYELGGLFFAYHESENGAGSRSIGYQTQAEAVADIEETIESHRKFWNEKIEWRKNGDRTIGGGEPGRVVRAHHRHYVIGPELGDQPNTMDRKIAGHGGTKFVFRLLETGEVIVSTNVWAQGQIPAEYWVRLPDNAELLAP